MKNFTYLFELFGKKGNYTCNAYSRKSADEQFKNMLMRNTRVDRVTEVNTNSKSKDSNEGNIFNKFTDIFGKDFPFGK